MIKVCEDEYIHSLIDYNEDSIYNFFDFVYDLIDSLDDDTYTKYEKERLKAEVNDAEGYIDDLIYKCEEQQEDIELLKRDIDDLNKQKN